MSRPGWAKIVFLCACSKIAQASEVYPFADENGDTPTWTITAAAFGALGFGPYGLAEAGFGARAGFRRWLNRNLLASVLLEYQRSYFVRAEGVSLPAGTVSPPDQAHQLAFLLRVEVAEWSDFSSSAFDLPAGSVYAYIAPVALVTKDIAVGDAYGFRFAIGGQFTGILAHGAPPPFLEVGWQHVSFARVSVDGFRVTFGVAV